MFELSVLFSLWAFIILMVGTPGPANLLAMSAGSQLGFYKCISFNLGLTLGKILLNTAMGLGLGVLLVNFTTFQTTIKFIGAGYMIYLALKSWNINIKNNEGKPNIGWKQGILVHPLNPKAWVMTLIAWTEFGPQLGNFTVQFIVITSSFALTQIFELEFCPISLLQLLPWVYLSQNLLLGLYQLLECIHPANLFLLSHLFLTVYIHSIMFQRVLQKILP